MGRTRKEINWDSVVKRMEAGNTAKQIAKVQEHDRTKSGERMNVDDLLKDSWNLNMSHCGHEDEELEEFHPSQISLHTSLRDSQDNEIVEPPCKCGKPSSTFIMGKEYIQYICNDCLYPPSPDDVICE